MPIHWLMAALLAGPARAWDQHARLTAAALRGAPGLDAPVAVETLASYLSATRGGSEAAFLQAKLLNPTVTFPFTRGETAGSSLPLREVIAGYADEPDGGMDQDLFVYYPQLWKPEYTFMIGGKTGFQTRVFRHSYWPFGYLKPPAAPGGMPIHVASPMGEAPDRAQLFFDESRKAFAAGHPYWGCRFLAWALHYLEDVTQPFHAVQIPSTALLRYKPTGELDLEASVRTVAYYHLAMDSFPVRAGQGALGPTIQSRLDAAISTGTTAAFVSARQLARDAARTSARKALKTADAMTDLFPDPTPADLADPLRRAYDPALWRDLDAAAKAHPAEAAALFGLAEGLLADFGRDVRALTAAATAAIPAPPGLLRGHHPASARALSDAMRAARLLP